jgi:hypothetical protein
LGCSTVNDGEGNELFGGKAPTIEDLGRGAAGPDAALDASAREPCASARRGQTVAPDPVYGAAPPRRRRGACKSVQATASEGRARSRRCDGDGVRGDLGGQPPRPARPAPEGTLPAAAGEENLHIESGRRKAASWRSRLGRQDRPRRGGGGAERRVRSRLLRLLLRLSANAQPAGRAAVWCMPLRANDDGAGELDRRGRHPEFLRPS